ncbi:MAG TPA: hypothetical protein VHX13_12055 [Acidobacteriaceae bacterium]|nr:hypothetical protein [Acidobacteriaceae bacterium]
MNSGQRLTPEQRIDAALRAVASATPEAGLQGRILNRLAAERMGANPAPSGLAGLLHRVPRFAGAAVTAVFVCVAGTAIVIGSVDHSRALHRAPVVAPLVPGLSGNGIGTASAVHPVAPVSVPVPASRSSRGRSSRAADRGRARIQRHSHKAAGVAVPAPDENSPK